MNNNPLAKTIYNSFKQNVVDTSNYVEDYACHPQNIEQEKKFKRIRRFTDSINNLFIKNGLPTFNSNNLMIDEKKLIHFALQISGYIRDDQKALNQLQNIQARDQDIVDLYRASAIYTVACTNQVPGNKYIFKQHKDYSLWNVENPQSLSSSAFTPIGQALDPKKKHLIMSMPFHIKTTESELQNWCYKYMHNVLEDKQIFGSQVNVSLAHFPIEQPRGEKFSLSLNTMKENNEYYDWVDGKFFKEYLAPFVGKDLKFDEKMNIISGQKYSAEEFQNNCKNLTILGYCAGTAHAHRWLNTMEKVANQLYTPEETAKAMSNVFVLSYAFLPFRDHNSYSGAHFMSNYIQDHNRKEPFIKMFNPELYEKAKYTPGSTPAKISLMPDKRNFIVALPLPQGFEIIEDHQKIVPVANQENGHHIAFITAPNLFSEDNFPYQQFRTVLENAVLGKRGINIFDHRAFNSSQQIIKSVASVAKRQPISLQNQQMILLKNHTLS